jgi:NAD-dependent SIR2 family protein deacetylase
MKCTKCKDGFVKPDIVFFGEGLPRDYFDALDKIENESGDEDGGCDLMIVIGTALAVSPFNSCVEKVKDGVPKLLWNLGNNKDFGYDFDDLKEFPGRLYMNGKCDETVF